MEDYDSFDGHRDYVWELEEERDKYLRDLKNLLAVIHRDGGHFTKKHGYDKSLDEAYEAVPLAFSQVFELRVAMRDLLSYTEQLEVVVYSRAGGGRDHDAVLRARELLK